MLRMAYLFFSIEKRSWSRLKLQNIHSLIYFSNGMEMVLNAKKHRQSLILPLCCPKFYLYAGGKFSVVLSNTWAHKIYVFNTARLRASDIWDACLQASRYSNYKGAIDPFHGTGALLWTWRAEAGKEFPKELWLKVI